jgi:hypothetical protein
MLDCMSNRSEQLFTEGLFECEKKHYTTSTEKCDEEEDNKQCPGGQWKDGEGCCPRKLSRGQWFYSDGRGSYPIELE